MFLKDIHHSLSQAKDLLPNAKVVLVTPDMNLWKASEIMINLDNRKVVIFLKPQEDIYI